MSQSAEVPEYFLDNPSARKYPQWDHSRAINQRFKDRMQARLMPLYLQLDMQADISVKILDLLQDLEQLELEQV